MPTSLLESVVTFPPRKAPIMTSAVSMSLPVLIMHPADKLARTRCKGIRAHLERVGQSADISELLDLDEHPHYDEPNDEWVEFWDDITGKSLKPDLVRAARMDEMRYFKRLPSGVFSSYFGNLSPSSEPLVI